MNKFDKQSKEQLNRAIYQGKTYILITPGEEAKVSINGRSVDVVNALQEASRESLVLRRIFEAVANPKPQATSKARFYQPEKQTV